MNGLSILQALGPIDAKNIRRDELLRWIIIAPIAMAALVRWVIPLLLTHVEDIMQLDLMTYYEPMAAFMVLLLTPYLAGLVIGFLLLDQRDDGTLTALQVTPLSLNGYLVYRLTMPMLVSMVMTLVAAPISGVFHMNAGILLLTAVCAAPFAPIFALLLASLAQNKVQGFAITKVAGIILIPPLIAYFVSAPWTIIWGVFPTYWPAMALWSAQAGEPIFWFYWGAGLVYQLLVLALLTRRFNVIMRR
jgi:fluoroquinolone transport system permease protein